MDFVTFSDIVHLRAYDSNNFLGFVTCDERGMAGVSRDPGRAINFCVTPHRFFAEDLELRDTTIRGTPITLQQLTWIPGYVWCDDRSMLILDGMVPSLERMDITNVTDERAVVEFFETATPQLAMNPRYRERYYMTLNGRFLTSMNGRLGTAQSPVPHGITVSMHFVATLGEDQAKNFPHSQAYQPYTTLPSQCTRSCYKCKK